MSPLHPWNKFWFTSAPYFDLAFIRLLIVGLQLFLLLSGFDFIMKAVGFSADIYNPLPVLKMLMVPWGWGARPDHLMVVTVFWVTVVAGVMAFIGLLTNFSLFIFAVGNIFLEAFVYSFGEQHHPSALMMITLLVFSFGPCGKVLSVDSLIKGLKQKFNYHVNLIKYGSQYAGWPIKLMQITFSLIYLSACLSKLTTGGIDWANGFTLQFFLVQDGLRWDSGLALWLAQFHYFIFFAQIVVYVFQSTFFLIIFFPKLKWIYLPLGLLFHIGIYLTLKAPFPQWILLYALFIPWSQVFQWVASSVVVADEPESQSA